MGPNSKMGLTIRLFLVIITSTLTLIHKIMNKVPPTKDNISASGSGDFSGSRPTGTQNLDSIGSHYQTPKISNTIVPKKDQGQKTVNLLTAKQPSGKNKFFKLTLVLVIDQCGAYPMDHVPDGCHG